MTTASPVMVPLLSLRLAISCPETSLAGSPNLVLPTYLQIVPFQNLQSLPLLPESEFQNNLCLNFYPCLYNSRLDGFLFSIKSKVRILCYIFQQSLYMCVLSMKCFSLILSTMPNRFVGSFFHFPDFSQRPLLEYSPAPLDVPPEPSVSVVVTLSLRVPSPHQLCHPHRHQCHPSTESTITGCESSVGEDIAKICQECFPSLAPAPKLISLV